MCPVMISSAFVLCCIMFLELLMCASLINLARAGVDMSDLTLLWDSYAHQLPLPPEPAPERWGVAADLNVMRRAHEAPPPPYGPCARLRTGRRPGSRCGWPGPPA
jgi:hypothetical protein